MVVAESYLDRGRRMQLKGMGKALQAKWIKVLFLRQLLVNSPGLSPVF